ncbi:DNA-binding protein, partial [Methylobacterium soli]
MVKRVVLFEAAGRMAAAGVYVTDRALLREIGRSFSDIGPLLNQWKGKRGYDSKLSRAGVPEKLQDAFAKLAGAMVQEMQSGLGVEFSRDIADLKAELEISKREIERLRSNFEVSQKTIGVHVAANEKLRRECEDAQKLAQRYRSEEFWDRVMQNIETILPLVGAMSGREVLAALPTDLRKEF